MTIKVTPTANTRLEFLTPCYFEVPNSMNKEKIRDIVPHAKAATIEIIA